MPNDSEAEAGRTRRWLVLGFLCGALTATYSPALINAVLDGAA